MTKPVYAICKQIRPRSACTCMHADQWLLFTAPLWKSGDYTGFTLSFRHSVIQSFHNLWNENVSSHFSQKLWGLESWNLVHIWTVGRCSVCTRIGLLLLVCPFISSIFFLSNFQTLKFFVTLFSGTVRPRRLKLCTHVDSGPMYCPFIFHFSFSPFFKH